MVVVVVDLNIDTSTLKLASMFQRFSNVKGQELGIHVPFPGLDSKSGLLPFDAQQS